VAQREGWIEDLAGAILDGASINWVSAESTANLAERSLVNQLRLLATVADLHRRPRSRERPGPVTAQENPFPAPTGPAIVDGKYLIEGSLGHGGMGFVYRARHIELKKSFALKLVQPHKSHRSDYLARFRIEAQALGRLNHPNIVQVTDFGVDPRAGPYLVMEYIEGITLSEYIKHRRTLPLDEALPLFSSIAWALDYAHDSGILHRDLKPANVLLFTRGTGDHDAKIVDFGIASFLDSPATPESFSESPATIDLRQRPAAESAPGPSLVGDLTYSESASAGLTAAGTILGTLEYIAPEVIKGAKASSSGDIYAFGVLIYEVLAGRRPFQASVLEQLNSDLHGEPRLPSGVCSSSPKELDQAILRPLNEDPLLRPRRARDVVRELREASHQAKLHQWRRTELPKRAGLSIVVAILVLLPYRLLQTLPPIEALENRLLDLRVSLQPLRSPDPRIVLISIDEATLASDSQPLAEKADEVGALLGRVFAAGARAVAIDLLLPEHWGRSESFSQLILDHSTNLVLASYSTPEAGVKGPESVKGLVTVALGREKIEDLFGFVNLSADRDGVVRAVPYTYRDQHGKRVQSLAARTAEVFTARSPVEALSATRFWIDYSIDWTKFQRVSWKDAPDVLAKQPESFRDRVVLVGGEFVGSGDVYNMPNTSAPPGEISGLVLQALTLNTLLEGRPIKTSDERFVIGFLCVALALAVMALLSLSGSAWTIGTLVLSGLLYIVSSLLLFRWNRELWPVAAPVVVFSVAIMCAVLLRHKLLPYPKFASEEKLI
jgi:serine/threonine protein kinase